MKDKKYYCGIITAAVGILLVLASPLQAAPTTWTFDSDLDNWTDSPGVSWAASDGDGYALFQEYSAGGISSLSNGFLLPSDALTLSFEMNFYTPGSPNCDEFTASLSGHVFYSRDSSGKVYDDEVTVKDIDDGWRIILDVSSLAGQPILLEFKLLSGDIDVITEVTLDNVIVVVPAPGALLLAAIGAGLAGWLRRSGKLR